MTSPIHDLLVVVHRWVALITGALLIVIALTGSALVFEGAMDRALNPQLWHVEPGTRWTSIDSMIGSARSVVPEPAPAFITLPETADRAAMVQVGANQVFVNPFTGSVQGRRTNAEADATLPRRLHRLHIALMSGQVGGALVGLTTAAAFFLVLSGIIVWWRDKVWRIRWSASWKRVIFDLHHSLGVFAAVILALVTSSGMALHYRPLSNALRRLDVSLPIPRQPAGSAGARPVPVDSVYHAAIRALPGANVTAMTLSPKPTGSFVVVMRFPEDGGASGRSRVYVDQFTGAVLLAVSTRAAALGTRIAGGVRDMHTGDVLGLAGQTLWFASTIVLALQAVTGAIMWWNGRKSRAALARKNANG